MHSSFASLNRTTAMSRPQDGIVQRDSSMVSPPELVDLVSAGTSDMKIDSDISFFGKKKPPATPLGISDDQYHMCHKHRGKAIIFNHERYSENLGLKVRKGTKADRDRLQNTLEDLGFAVRVFDDLTKKELIEKLIREQQNNFHYMSDCLVVVVLTHGAEKGRLYAKDDFYTVSELWAPFMADNCSALAAKPKVFIIQACRGDSPSRAVGVNTNKLTTDSIKMPDESAGATFTIPNEADILVAYSTYEGRVAYRDTDEGTWYISELCKEMDKSAKVDDLLTMLTRVNRQVALTKANFEEKQMPSLQSTLTRKIYFYSDELQTISASSLQEIHSKLDRLLNAWEGGLASPSSLPTTDTTPNYAHKARDSGWEFLRGWSGASAVIGALPVDEVALRHAKALKLFLQQRGKEDYVYETGKTILALLSFWNALDTETRVYAHTRTKTFLKKHAQEWPVLEIIDLGFPLQQHDGTLGTRSRKTSRSSSQSLPTASHSKPRLPFK